MSLSCKGKVGRGQHLTIQILEQIALTTFELEDARHDEIDVEGLLGSAEYVLTHSARLWMEATAEQRPRLQRALFPEGLRLRDGRIGTAVTCMAFTQLQTNEGDYSGMASPGGFAKRWVFPVYGRLPIPSPKRSSAVYSAGFTSPSRCPGARQSGLSSHE